MNPTVRHIEIGLVGDRPSITLHLDNGAAQTIIFSLEAARELSWGLAGLCERMTPSRSSRDHTATTDNCSIALQPPKEE